MPGRGNEEKVFVDEEIVLLELGEENVFLCRENWDNFGPRAGAPRPYFLEETPGKWQIPEKDYANGNICNHKKEFCTKA